MKKLFSSLFVLLLVLIFGCVNKVEMPPPGGALHYSLIVDESIDAQYKLAIIAAIDEWAEKTDNMILYDITYTNMSVIPRDQIISNTIRIYLEYPGKDLYGWTNWNASKHQADIFILPLEDLNAFRKVMLHELGHAFDLHFNNDATHYNGPYKSIMFSKIPESCNHLTCVDLQAFCNSNGCEINCANELL